MSQQPFSSIPPAWDVQVPPQGAPGTAQSPPPMPAVAGAAPGQWQPVPRDPHGVLIIATGLTLAAWLWNLIAFVVMIWQARAGHHSGGQDIMNTIQTVGTYGLSLAASILAVIGLTRRPRTRIHIALAILCITPLAGAILEHLVELLW